MDRLGKAERSSLDSFYEPTAGALDAGLDGRPLESWLAATWLAHGGSLRVLTKFEHKQQQAATKAAAAWQAVRVVAGMARKY